MMNRKCDWDSFAEPLTGGKTCTNCILVCHPVYQTPHLCQQYCPDYLEAISTSFLPFSVTPSSIHNDNIIVHPTTVYIILTLVIVILACLYLVSWRFHKKIYKGRGKKQHKKDCKDVEDGPLMGDDTKRKTVSPKSNASSSGACSGQSSNQFVTPRTSSSENDLISCDKLATGLTTGGDATRRLASGVSLGNKSVMGSTTPKRSNLDSESRVCYATDSGLTSNCSAMNISIASKRMQTGSTAPFYISLQSRRTNMLEHYDGSMQTSAISWQYVMSAYDAINCNLHEMNWIVGCILSYNKIQVVVDQERASDETQLHNHIKNIIPENIPSEVYQLTFNTPSLRTRCGQYGTGCMIMNDRGMSAKVTLLALSVNQITNVTEVFAFTVAHLLKEGDKCQLQCNCSSKIIHQEDATCLGHIDTVKEEVVHNIKHKLYDLSLLRIPAVTSLDNACRFIAKGRQITFDIDVQKCDIFPHTMMSGRKVLIFADHSSTPIAGCIDDEAVFTCVTNLSRKQQVINLIQIKCIDTNKSFDIGGISGSLVAWHPDYNCDDDEVIRVDAFAFIVGTNVANPQKAFALLLWEQMRKLFQNNKSLAHLEKSIAFKSTPLSDTGFYSKCDY